ncbi:hypothetical protein K492DRAFT_198935 [Lichtheimia hyalospora FSU 10163]|nr:hypothetical protein K492DRAFT_198935 [Lichtheimia hyalospora FSU 10163]
MPSSSSPPSCAIQDCLAKNHYQESKCEDAIRALRQCCEALLDNGGESPCCPKRKYGKQARQH